MYKYYNPNPTGKQVGDCVIRAVAFVTFQTWDETYIDICLKGFELKDMPSSNYVWETYLFDKGFYRKLLPDAGLKCYTVKNFCDDYRDGLYMLATGSHVIAVNNGDYYDAWDSGNEIPIYYWLRKEQINGNL